MIHGKALMVLAGEDNITHTAVLGQGDDLLCVKSHRIECAGQLSVLLARDTKARLNPLADVLALLPLPLPGRERVEPPVHHQSKAVVGKPLCIVWFHSVCLCHGPFDSAELAFRPTPVSQRAVTAPFQLYFSPLYPPRRVSPIAFSNINMEKTNRNGKDSPSSLPAL